MIILDLGGILVIAIIIAIVLITLYIVGIIIGVPIAMIIDSLKGDRETEEKAREEKIKSLYKEAQYARKQGDETMVKVFEDKIERAKEQEKRRQETREEMRERIRKQYEERSKKFK